MFSISFKRETTWDKVPFTITNFSFFSQPNFFFFFNQSYSFQHQLKQTAISYPLFSTKQGRWDNQNYTCEY